MPGDTADNPEKPKRKRSLSTRQRALRKASLAPGTALYTGQPVSEKPRITLLTFDEAQYQETVLPFSGAWVPNAAPAVSWLNIDGVHDVELLKAIGDGLAIHSLTIEDIAHTEQRPKLEDYDSYLFIIMKMLQMDSTGTEVIHEQVSLILGQNFVISFQETAHGDVFDPVRNRIKNTRWRARKLGADYLAYALLDAVVDHYFVILEKLGDKSDLLEEQMRSRQDTRMLEEIYQLKKDLIFLRKSVWPLRGVIGALIRSESELIREETRIYFNDIHDHTLRVIETVDSYREVLTNLTDLYMITVSHKMNEIMKFLTIIATLFIPPTFIAGVYGMNFQWMPELAWPFAYPAVMIFMGGMIGGMLLYFKHRRWF